MPMVLMAQGDLFSLLGAILMLVCVLFLAYWCSRFLGKGLMRASTGRNMKVIEQMGMGPNKQIVLLRVGEHTYLLGVGQNGIQLLTEVEGELAETSADGAAQQDSAPRSLPAAFEEVMKRYAASHGKEKKKTDD